MIDVAGEGFHLTSADDGVRFDIEGTGTPIQIAWTDSRFHNGFLALPNIDGIVQSGKDLFGNFTQQPASDHPNGFLALAEYDRPENGGNGDGVIDNRDRIFSSLRIWRDENHDGVCQRSELYTLTEVGVQSISLNYQLSHRVDQFGNVFRFRADVNSGLGGNGGLERKTYDVFLTTKKSTP